MKLLEFFLTTGKLKQIERTGWKRYAIPHPESVAEHSFRTAILAYFLAPKVGVDQDKAVKMALVHDIAEAEICDIVTHKGTKELPIIKEKLKKERDAFTQILSMIDDNVTIQLFDEFEENNTHEARFVKQIDALEMAIQAFEYEQEHNINLQEFFDYAKSRIDTELLLSIFDKLITQRKISRLEGY